jgi:hypothetical protein
MKQCSKNYGSPVYSFRNVVVGLVDAVLNIVELVAQMSHPQPDSQSGNVPTAFALV